MEDGVDTLEAGTQCGSVGQVCDGDVDGAAVDAVHVERCPGLVGVADEHAHAVPTGDGVGDAVRPDEAGAAGDGDVHVLPPSDAPDIGWRR